MSLEATAALVRAARRMLTVEQYGEAGTLLDEAIPIIEAEAGKEEARRRRERDKKRAQRLRGRGSEDASPGQSPGQSPGPFPSSPPPDGPPSPPAPPLPPLSPPSPPHPTSRGRRSPSPPGGWPPLFGAVLEHANAVTGRSWGTRVIPAHYGRLMKARALELYHEAKAKDAEAENKAKPLALWRRVYTQMIVVWDEKWAQSQEMGAGSHRNEASFDPKFVRPETLYTGKFHTYIQEARDRAEKNGGVCWLVEPGVYGLKGVGG